MEIKDKLSGGFRSLILREESGKMAAGLSAIYAGIEIFGRLSEGGTPMSSEVLPDAGPQLPPQQSLILAAELFVKGRGMFQKKIRNGRIEVGSP